MPRTLRVCVVSASLVFAIACAEPPSKEMNQAQGAIDAARAAGAEQYAPAELEAAIAALKLSEDAVVQNDHRLALSQAIESRDRAQQAAKTAVETRAKARGDAERSIAELNAILTRARDRLDDQDVARLPRRTLTESRQTLDAATQTMQEARAAVDRNEYGRALELTKGVSARIEEVLAAIDKAAAPAPARKRR